MKIANKKLEFSYNRPPKIIAEISGNHNGSKSRFLKLVKKACESDADLIKIQTYEPKDITVLKRNHLYKIKNGLWKEKFYFDLYKKACTPFAWHKEAFAIAKRYKKIIFSSPFSIRAVDLLEQFNVPIYKIASFEITDYKLINYIASKKKPIIISTGMASISEIMNAIKIIEKYHKKIIILHCVSNYPTKTKDTNLIKINFLKKKFRKYLIGLSDHTDNIFSSIASIPLGIVAIEKHFNLDKKKTSDSAFSIGPKMLKQLKKISLEIFESLNKKKSNKLLNKNIKFRRSIYTKFDILKNEKISNKNIEVLRPKIGICASQYYKVLGRKVKKNIKANSPLFTNYLK